MSDTAANYVVQPVTSRRTLDLWVPHVMSQDKATPLTLPSAFLPTA
jgi:hypothetical protein